MLFIWYPLVLAYYDIQTFVLESNNSDLMIYQCFYSTGNPMTLFYKTSYLIGKNKNWLKVYLLRKYLRPIILQIIALQQTNNALSSDCRCLFVVN